MKHSVETTIYLLLVDFNTFIIGRRRSDNRRTGSVYVLMNEIEHNNIRTNRGRSWEVCVESTVDEWVMSCMQHLHTNTLDTRHQTKARKNLYVHGAYALHPTKR